VLLKKDKWKSEVQDKLENSEYVTSCAKVVLKK